MALTRMLLLKSVSQIHVVLPYANTRVHTYVECGVTLSSFSILVSLSLCLHTFLSCCLHCRMKIVFYVTKFICGVESASSLLFTKTTKHHLCHRASYLLSIAVTLSSKKKKKMSSSTLPSFCPTSILYPPPTHTYISIQSNIPLSLWHKTD